MENNLVRWQCSDFVNIFPEFMNSINTLKNKRKKTDEDTILEEIISKGNAHITSKDTINNIFEYAVHACYIHRGTYKDHHTYKINEAMEKNIVCKACGEPFVVSDWDIYKVSAEVKYVDVHTFEQLASEINEIKNYTKNTSKIESQNIFTKCKELESEIIKLSQELEKKDELINTLKQSLFKITSDKNSIKFNQAQAITATDEDWQVTRRNNNQHNDRTNALIIPSGNSFNDLPVDDDVIIDSNSDGNDIINSGDADIASVKQRETCKDNHKVENKSKVYINPYPERDQLLFNNVLKDIPRGTKSAEITKTRRKAVIISDSITKRIDMREFSDLTINGDALKRAFPGATASQK